MSAEKIAVALELATAQFFTPGRKGRFDRRHRPGPWAVGGWRTGDPESRRKKGTMARKTNQSVALLRGLSGVATLGAASETYGPRQFLGDWDGEAMFSPMCEGETLEYLEKRAARIAGDGSESLWMRLAAKTILEQGDPIKISTQLGTLRALMRQLLAARIYEQRKADAAGELVRMTNDTEKIAN